MSNNGSNTSNAGGPTAMSNASRGTRVVSAGDWVRLKRLMGARSSGYSYTTGSGTIDGLLTDSSPIFNKDVAPSPSLQVPYLLPIHSFAVAGTSKYKRTASNWIDHIAFKNADVVLSSQVSQVNGATVLTRLRLCDCTTTNLANKDVVCRSCSTRKPQGQQQTTDMDGPGGGGGGRIIINWQGYDADDALIETCYTDIISRDGSLPITFDPCVESFSFSFSNILNAQDIRSISITSTGYDFTGYTLGDVSISSGMIIGINGMLNILQLNVSGFSTSSVITVNAVPRLCFNSLDDICITAEPPAPPPPLTNTINATSWSTPIYDGTRYITSPTFSSFVLQGEVGSVQTLTINFSNIPTTDGIQPLSTVRGILVGGFFAANLDGGLPSAIAGSSIPTPDSANNAGTNTLFEYLVPYPAIGLFQGETLLISLTNNQILNSGNALFIDTLQLYIDV